MGTTRKYVAIDPATGKLDRRIFSQQAIYDDEMEKIFGRNWLMIGHENLVPAGEVQAQWPADRRTLSRRRACLLYRGRRRRAEGAGAARIGAGRLGHGIGRLGRGRARARNRDGADSLGPTLDKVRALHGSTTLPDDGYGAFHSRSTVLGGSAMHEGAALLLGEIREAAAARLGCAAGEIELVDGKATAKSGRSVDFAELAADGLVADYSFANDHRHTYAYGTVTAHVAVAPRTGRVELLDYLVVEDVGRINPLTLHGQVVGATVQGLGGAFTEDLVYDANGQMLAGTLADYLIPSATGFPNIRAISLQHRPSPTNPLGVKGAGEGGIISVGGLMANAVAGALSSLGAAPNELPLSPSRVWRSANPGAGITDSE